MLRNFLGLFVLTFMICCFILLMQFLWMHVNDLVGKGVEVPVLMEFFIYSIVSVVPLALPLAILLASLMTFGNLGEKFELTAMKSAGVSLFRIMRPLTIFIGLVAVGAFFFSNYMLPASQSKLWALIFSLRQKSPELDIPVAEFYDGVHGYNLYVRKKNTRTGLMEGMMIYDYTNGFENASVTVADSGRVFFTQDNRYLLLRLYSGESFENLDQQQQRATGTQQNVPYRREMFREKQLLIDFNTELNRYDESVLQDQHVSKNVRQLVHSIDSVSVLHDERAREQGSEMVSRHYFGRERMANRDLGDTIAPALVSEYSLDSLKASLNEEQMRRALAVAVDRAQSQKDQVAYNSAMLNDYGSYLRHHQIELQRRYTLSFACLIFFFIGAPLGAIIRKGGLGAPIVISVIMFIIYYIIDNTGYKMAREGLWPVWQGMWLSSAVLLPIGIFLSYKAATDSGIFNPEVWVKIYERMVQKIKVRWTKLKKH
ncbi:MAG: LptF/LptG family permease [Paludibacteraceae bacterium]|nr:LptF/LptG family permease [Paludibacteraceae bacterium]